MPYIPEAIPPEAIPEAPPEETATPVATDQTAPPMTEEQRYGIAPAPAPVEATAAADAPPMTDEQRYGIGAEQEIPPPPDNRMGSLVDPLMAQAPEPVRNLANIVGQPIGGLVDAVQAIGGQLAQGDIPGAAEQTLPVIGAPQMRQREQAGQRIINDQPITLTAQDLPQHGILSPILDPIANSAVGQAIGGVLTAPLPGTQNLPPPPTAIGGAALGSDPGAALTGQPGTVLGPLGIQDWWDSLPPEDQAALSAQGGNAVIDAFETYINASPIPPPNLSNPLDAGKPGDNPLQRGAAILGAIPGSAGAWGDTIQTGTLPPFLKNQAIEALMDPALLVPHPVGEAVLGAGKSLLRKTPGVSRLGELTTEAKRAIQGERIGTAAEEVINSRAVLNDAGVAPADPLTQGAGSPPPNGRQSPTIDPGQAGSAAPPIPAPPQIVERPVAGIGSIFEVQQDGRVRGQFPTRESAEEFVNPRPRTAPPDPERPRTIPDQPRTAPERPTVATPRDRTPTTPKAAQAPPSRTALGIKNSNWVRLVNGKEERVVANKRIRPEFQADVRRVYEDMKTAPADQFWEPFPGTIKDVNVPIGDEGAYARYRAAMNQGYYLFDDWGTDRAISRLPPKLQSSPGVIDWGAVEREAADLASPFADNAQRALAGKNAVTLYTYRIEHAPTVRGPDGLTGADIEVEHLLLNYHLDQLSERFKKAQFGENTSYWRDRADMLSEVLRRSGYLPSDAALAKWRRLNLADVALEAYPELAGTLDLRRLQGKSLIGMGRDGADLLAHLPDSSTRVNRTRPLYALTDTQYYASDLITPETRPALEAALRDRLDKYGLSDVALRLVDTLSDVIRDAPEDARGVYQPFERVMTLALREADELPLSQGERVGLVMDHEVIHALRGLDLFTADEWDTLVRTAKEQGIGPAMVSDDYAALERWNPQMAQEELVAHLYEAWRIGKVTLGRRPASIIEKLFTFFRGLGQALKDTYPEEILHAIENGDIGRRPRTITPAVERPAASLAPPPTPEQFALRMRRRQSAAAATAAAPAPVREAVASLDDPHFTRYGETTSEQAAKDLAQSADGLFHFRDGWKVQGSGMTVDDLLRQTLNDVEFWANVERISKENGGWSDTRSTTMMRQWQQLDKRFNPDGTVDRSLLAGPANDLERLKARQEFALKVFQEAEQRARPKDKPTRIGAINQEYLNFYRTSALFNYLNIPKYVVQNVVTNSINMGARIGAAGNWDLWTHPADFGRIFKANRAAGRGESYLTRWGSLEKQIGMGSKPNIAQSHVKYLGEKGRLPKYLDRASRVIAPETLRYVGTTADQIFRETAADTVVNREFRKLNRDLVPKVMKELDSRSLRIPDAKVRQVVHDFLDEHRARIDANTGEAYRTMLGRPATGEPVWNPERFGQYLKQHLTEDMLHKPDPGDFNRAIDRITRDSKTRVRGILDTAEQSVDDAFFSWRDTNADAQLRKFFLFHYWTTRQGGFFLQEAIKRPVLLSSYGRMMAEMKQQAEDLEQPPWMTGFFQFQNSVAGLSTWGSPFDIVQSVLSFADWQEGSEDDKYKDLTALGKGASTIPFLIHPALQFVAYELGLLGPDYYPPMVTGTETFGANAINLLNLANAQGKLPDWVPGHDANGNPIPLPVRPLQELYARVGNALSSALAPLTGLSPVEVQNMVGSQQRNIASIMETETRRAYPEWDQMQVNAFVTEKLQDPGSPEYQAALRKSADMPFQLMDGMPGIISGAARLASPIQIYSWPEQYNLDRWPVTPSGYVPPRTIPHLNEIDPATGELTPAGERAKYVAAAAKYGATTTPEGRQLANEQNEWYALEPLDYAEANDLAGKLYGIYDGNIDETVTIGGVEYTPEMIRSLERGDLYDLGTQALADAGYTREQQTAIKDAQSRYLADHPDLAGYFEYKDLIKANPNGVEGFVNETAAVNPGFRQFVRSSMMDHITGEIDYGHAEYVDAYLASQGIRPSVYSPIVGNEPSTVPGGYPALAGGTPGQPLLPPVTATEPISAYSKPVAADDWGKDKYQVAWIDPAVTGKMQVIANPDQYSKGMAQVLLHDGTIGYIDASYLQNAAPPQPSTPPGRAPAPVIDQGGLASLAGNATGLLGQAKDAAFGALGAGKEAIGSLFGAPTAATATEEARYLPSQSAVDPKLMTSDASGQSIIDLAQQYVGVDYQHNFPSAGDDPWQTGWDCSSFIHWLADNAGISEKQYPNDPGYVGGGVPVGSHFQWQWAQANDLVVGTSWQDAQPGDAIYFSTDPNREWCDPHNYNGCMNNDASHVALYLGLDPETGRPLMMHAAAPGIGTVYDYVDTYPYPALGVVRWLPE